MSAKQNKVKKKKSMLRYIIGNLKTKMKKKNPRSFRREETKYVKTKWQTD